MKALLTCVLIAWELQAVVPITITPSAQTITPGQVITFTTTSTSPRWGFTGAGALSQAGVYTAPIVLPSDPFRVVQVFATDANTFQTATATLTLVPAISGGQQFTATEMVILKQMLNLIGTGNWKFICVSNCVVTKP